MDESNASSGITSRSRSVVKVEIGLRFGLAQVSTEFGKGEPFDETTVSNTFSVMLLVKVRIRVGDDDDDDCSGNSSGVSSLML